MSLHQNSTVLRQAGGLRHITACVCTRRLAAHLPSLAPRIRSSLLFPPAVGDALQDLRGKSCPFHTPGPRAPAG